MSEYCRDCGTHISEDDESRCHHCEMVHQIKSFRSIIDNHKSEIERLRGENELLKAVIKGADLQTKQANGVSTIRPRNPSTLWTP